MESLLSFIITASIIEITPGPNMAYLAILSLGEGRRAGFAAVAGIALGLFTIGIAAAFGVAALVASSNIAYQTLRWGGVFYLLWLAWDGWNTEKETAPERTNGHAYGEKFFKRGLITNLLNPKAAIFYIAVLPSFVNASSSLLGQTVTLTFVYVFIATFIHFFIVLLAGTARQFFEKPGQIIIVRRVLSLMLICVALWFAVSTAGGVP